MNRTQRILDFFFPPRCPACGEVVRSGEVFCAPCRDALCGSKTKKFTHGQRLAFSYAVYTMDYIGRTKPAIRNLKKLPDSAEAHFFGALLAQEIRTALPDMEYSCVTAVPMSEEKRRKRRHNHAETLARCLAAELSLPYADNLLSQREDGVKQHDLSRAERIARAAACYRAVEGAAVSGRVILVDDVLTTGATLDCCASLLHTLGAEDVIAATAVSTPPDHDKKSERSGNNGVK